MPRKRVRYFDLEKIERNDEPLAPSELEVQRHLTHDPHAQLELRETLDVAIAQLPLRERTIFLRHAEGHTTREIGAALHISHVMVHKILTRAKARLKKILAQG